MYKVRIDRFEGPFDLLVYLLENAKMNIYDIKVSEITEQYIDYLKEMENLDIEVGSEFIVLAAVLIKLKSHMLLPRVNEAGETIIEEDPRTELANRLAEYVRIKRAAEILSERYEYYSAVHTKPAEDMSEYLDSPDEILKVDEAQMVAAFRQFLNRKQRVDAVTERYSRPRRKRETIEERIRRMQRSLEIKFKDSSEVMFSELLPEKPDRMDVTISFMSLLAMIKNQEIDAEQEASFGEIILRRTNVQ